MAERKYLMLLRPPQQPCLVARQTTFLLISPGIRRVLFGGVCIYTYSMYDTYATSLGVLCSWWCSWWNSLFWFLWLMAFLLWQHHCFAPREAKFWTTFYNHCPHNSFRAIYVWFPYRLKYTTFKKHSLSNSLIFIKSHVVLSRDMFWTSFKATFILKEML